MVNINKLSSELENIIYEENNKFEADKLFKLYLNLFNQVDFTDYKVNLKKNPIKLMIKHKAYSNNVLLYYQNNKLYLQNKEIDLENINKILPTYFLDKKEEK